MKLIVGLGNPEQKYIGTRHNVGYEVVDAIIRRHKAPEVVTQVIDTGYSVPMAAIEQAILLKPQDGMNNSGIAVKALCDVFEILPEDVIVIYDDMDFSPGQVKLKPGGGGDGRHNGVKSIISHIGNNFIRLRLGIDKPRTKEEGIVHVLEHFKKDERARIDDAVILAMIAVDNILQHGIDKAMSLTNTKETK